MLNSKTSQSSFNIKGQINDRYIKVKKSVIKNWDLYLLLLPPLIFFIIFKYRPMAGVIIAFKNYKFKLGFWKSPWANAWGFEHFVRFFQNAFFKEIIWNTVSLSVMQLIFSFPIPIILAIITNELKNKRFKKTLQTITYAPHFISTVIVVAILEAMVNPNTGVINQFISNMNGDPIYFMGNPSWFKPLYITSGIWQNAGYNSIIYMAALANIDPSLIEAANIDGANRLRIIWHITIPAIIPTTVILLIMNFGSIMNIGFEKAYLMQNSMNVRTSEVISTYVYKSGIENLQYSYSTAVGLFNAIINIILLFIVNKIAGKLTETSLW